MGAMHSDGKLTITEDIMTDLVYTKISWVRDQDIQISGKQVILYFIYVFMIGSGTRIFRYPANR